MRREVSVIEWARAMFNRNGIDHESQLPIAFANRGFMAFERGIDHDAMGTSSIILAL